MKVYIGIDNGATGSIGIIDGDNISIVKTPIKVVQDYTKAKKNISRLDYDKFYEILDRYPFSFVGMERPLVSPKLFFATASALRVFEAQLVAIEHLKIPYIVVDSKEWAKEFFPKDATKGDTKRLSNEVGLRLFPTLVNPHTDYDAILMAEYLRRRGY